MATNYLTPTIPTNITVHLGAPDNKNAKNITIPFQEYIKNVASSEIYPSWPEDAIKANVLAQISFALNRIYNEWYPSKGYSFDITSLPSYDQTFIEDREFFENIVRIVDNIFNNYIVREGQIQPLFAQYCDGRVTTCNGLSQWGSVSLANQGKDPLDILKYYYGNNVNIIYNAPLADNISSYPGFPLEIGSAGDNVVIIKRQLNRIRKNYPAIPQNDEKSEFFTVETENSVRTFQNIFNLDANGIVDKATWYKIKYIYNSVKKISDLNSEGISKEEAELLYATELKYLDTGIYIRLLHYILRTIAYFDSEIPLLASGGMVFNENTVKMVLAFQKKYGLPTTGVVDKMTWGKLIEVYNDTINSIPNQYLEYVDEFYGGRHLTLGITGDDVRRLQKILLKICREKRNIPGVRVTGEYDELTERSVRVLQKLLQLPVNGIVGGATWNDIVEYSKT
ncbi:MAG: spore cortex-lytic protein [Bacilli bacterium]|nr:spore cortex-lytic protein [Bacilli bacterium]